MISINTIEEGVKGWDWAMSIDGIRKLIEIEKGGWKRMMMGSSRKGRGDI